MFSFRLLRRHAVLRALVSLARDLRHWPWRQTLAGLRVRFDELRLGQTAGSLTFTTLISLVPLLVLSLALFTAFPMFASFQKALEQYFLSNLVPDGIARPVLRTLTQFAGKARGIGTVGALLLAFTALALMLTMDRGGNPLQIVHRDVTPHNIMITRDGVAKLMDFGIAQTNANRAEQRGVLRGTLAYMSPEQVRGRWLDRRADIFALGVVLYELTTGTRLFRGEDVQVMTSIVETDIRPPSTIVSGYPADLEAILMATLRRDRDHRIASASDLSAHLEHFGMRNGMMLGPRQVARYVTEVAPAQRVLEPELALVTNEPAPTQTLDSAAYALPLARPRADSGPFEDVQDLDLEELEPLEASVAFGGRDTLTDVPVVRGVEVPHRAAGAGAYAEGPAVILDTQKRVTAERSFLDELDRRLRDD